MVIVVAFTAITSFVIPAQLDSGTVLRFSYTLLAGFLGIFGLTSGVLITAAHLAKVRSFGVPYLTPLAPIVFSDLSRRMPKLWKELEDRWEEAFSQLSVEIEITPKIRGTRLTSE